MLSEILSESCDEEEGEVALQESLSAGSHSCSTSSSSSSSPRSGKIRRTAEGQDIQEQEECLESLGAERE